MNKHLITVLFLSAGALALATTADAGTKDGFTGTQPNAKITGTVIKMDESKSGRTSRPIGGATLVVVDTDTGQPVARTLTDRRGKFSITVFGPASYLIVAKKLGEGSAEVLVRVEAGERITTRLMLQ